MSKVGYTDITFVLDRSGSMATIANDVRGGFNEYIKGQKNLPGIVKFSLIQFDDKYQVDYSGLDLLDVPELTIVNYIPRGWTALLDAVNKAIETTGKRLRDLPESERPEKVLFIVYTDGLENYSKETTTEILRDRIRHQEDKYNWQFVFMGANQDSWATAQTLGMSNSRGVSSWNSTPAGTRKSYDRLLCATSNYRAAPAAAAFAFDNEKEEVEVSQKASYEKLPLP